MPGRGSDAGPRSLCTLGARDAGPRPRCTLRLEIVLTRLSTHRDRGPAAFAGSNGLLSRGQVSMSSSGLPSPGGGHRCARPRRRVAASRKGHARRSWGKSWGRWLRAARALGESQLTLRRQRVATCWRFASLRSLAGNGCLGLQPAGASRRCARFAGNGCLGLKPAGATHRCARSRCGAQGTICFEHCSRNRSKRGEGYGTAAVGGVSGAHWA